MQRTDNGRSTYQVVERLLALRDLLRQASFTREQIVGNLPEYYIDDESGARKIRRDLQYLTKWGYRVERDKAQKTYFLSVKAIESDWSSDELAALAAVRESFKPGLPYAEAIQSIIKRIDAGLNADDRKAFARKPTLNIELAVMEKQTPASKAWRALDESIQKHRRVSFQYKPLDRAKVDHPDVEPIVLEFRDGHYYCVAYSHTTNNFYDYRIDQIVTDSIRPLPSRATGGWTRRMLDFQYRLSPKLAKRGASPRFPEIVAFDPQPDGSLVVTARGYNEFWIIREILRYGEQAEIIAPDPLRAMMRQVVEKMGRLYCEVAE